MWYVVQVLKGRERAMAKLLGRVAPAGLVEEAFSPTFQTQTKRQGQWESVERTLLPGYFIVVTREPEHVAETLRALPEFGRVLKQNGAYVPLEREEVAFIGGFTEPGARCIPMSMGIKDGDRVVVTEGPLVGHEGLISGINRHKSIAYLQFDICGRTVTTRVGLGVVSAAGAGVDVAAAEAPQSRVEAARAV